MPVKRLLAASALSFAYGCSPPCSSLSSPPEEVCRPADAGAVVAGEPFELMGITSLVDASCTVSVDGGQLALLLEGNSCAAGSGAPFAKPSVQKHAVPCAVPALAEGTWVANSFFPLSFTLPDAGIPSCP